MSELCDQRRIKSRKESSRQDTPVRLASGKNAIGSYYMYLTKSESRIIRIRVRVCCNSEIEWQKNKEKIFGPLWIEKYPHIEIQKTKRVLGKNRICSSSKKFGSHSKTRKEFSLFFLLPGALLLEFGWVSSFAQIRESYSEVWAESTKVKSCVVIVMSKCVSC